MPSKAARQCFALVDFPDPDLPIKATDWSLRVLSISLKADCATEKPAESTTPAEEPTEDPAEGEGEQEQDGGSRRLSTIVNTGNACWIKGQTTTP